MKVRVAAVQPLGNFGEEEFRNVEACLKYLTIAVDLGAQLVCFPEGYPGPYSGPMDSGGKLSEPPLVTLATEARRNQVFVYAGCLEVNPSLPDTYYLCHKLISPAGEVLATYRRTHPTHPLFNEALMGGKKHIVPGNELIVVDTEIGKLGLCICSEIWAPEVPRVLMLKGADIILAPGSGPPPSRPLRSRLRDTWHAIAWARAAENLVYLVMNQTCFAKVGGLGRTAIFAPENKLATLTSPGVLVADLDLNRLPAIRNRYFDEEVLSPPQSEKDLFFARPGQIYDRRPELYSKLVEPIEQCFDYRYFDNDLESYKKEYERVKHFRL
jgi:predicted amidohydrolase